MCNNCKDKENDKAIIEEVEKRKLLKHYSLNEALYFGELSNLLNSFDENVIIEIKKLTDNEWSIIYKL